MVVNISSLIELMVIVPELINLFFPGFIFLHIFKKLFDINIENSSMVLWSLLISYTMNTFYSVAHGIVFTSYVFWNSTKTLIYLITGVVLPFVIYKIHQGNLYKKFLLKTDHRTINDDIFDDIIDFDEKTLMKVFLKDSDIFYVGTFILKEEKNRDPYIVLIDYAVFNKNNVELSRPDYPTSVVFKMDNIERIEFIYGNDSKVWKWLSDKK